MSILSPVICVLTLALAVQGGTTAAAGADGTERKIAQLEKQVEVLRESYALARADADTARRRLAEIRARMEALGGAALGNGEENLLDTVAQLEASRTELERVRTASQRLAAAVVAYARNAMVEDEAARTELEAALLELDVATGLRAAQLGQVANGLDDATVISIDTESGLVVINAGRAAKVQVGMPIRITRGDQVIAFATVTDVRKNVAGMLVQQHLNPALRVSVGDRVSVNTND